MLPRAYIGKIRIHARRLIGSPSKLYLVLALPTVLGFIVFTPPFHGPDEDAHFLRAYSIASGDILPKALPEGIGSLLPQQVGQSIEETSYSPDIRGRTSQKHDPILTLKELNDGVTESQDLVFYDLSATSASNPVAYLTAVIGVLPFSIFDGPPLAAMYAARFITGLTTVLLFYVAIRLYPWRKIIPAAVFLLPMLLFQQSVVSIDGISYAVLALFVSVIALSYAKAKAPSSSQWIAIGALAGLLCFMKPLLFLFLPLILVLVKKDTKTISIVSVIVFACMLLLAAWYVGVGKLYEDSIRLPVATGAMPEEQIAYLKENPLRAVRVAWNTYATTYGDGQSRGLVGTFGSADTSLPLWVAAVSVVTTFVALVFGRNARSKVSTRSNKRVIWLTVALAVLYFVAVNASMYVAYTPVGFDIFYGVQGRYFIPILLLLPLALLGRSITLSANDDRRVYRYVVLGILFCLAISLLTVVQRYYWYTP